MAEMNGGRESRRLRPALGSSAIDDDDDNENHIKLIHTKCSVTHCSKQMVRILPFGFKGLILS
jgi:hypothetical protein